MEAQRKPNKPIVVDVKDCPATLDKEKYNNPDVVAYLKKLQEFEARSRKAVLTCRPSCVPQPS